MLPPFDPDPDCPFCSGAGFVGDRDRGGRCECTNWSSYAKLRRTEGLTMKQALERFDSNPPASFSDDCEIPF
jgi:hypothetical protein